MIRLLNRHVLLTVLGAAAGAVILIGFIFAAGNLLRDLLGYMLDGRLSAGMFWRLTWLLLPLAASYALPIGLLTGVLLALGRLSADHEITAMRGAGLSLWRISRPIIALALIGTVVELAVNFHLMPLARSAYQKELQEALRNSALNFLVPRTFIRDFSGAVVYINEKQGDALRDVWVWKLDKQQRVIEFIRADQAVLTFDTANEAIIINVSNAVGQRRDEKDPENVEKQALNIRFEETTVNLPLDKVLGRRSENRKLKWLTFSELMAEKKRIAGTDPHAEIKLAMTLQEKISTAVAVLTFVIVGIPLGIRVQRKETSANLGVAVVLVLSYYFLTICVGWLDRHPALRPDLLLWAPNILFLALGLWLFRRVEHT